MDAGADLADSRPADQADLLTLHRSSLARRRMLAIAGTAVFYFFVFTGLDVALPLWMTSELGYSAGDFANMRSLRMAAVLVCVIPLGALSDRFGQRRLGALSILAAAGLFALLGGGLGRGGIWLAVPLIGAMISTGFVNINVLTQHVSDRRQGLANSIYRTTSAGMAIVAPYAVTAVAAGTGSYRMVYWLFAGAMVAAAGVLWLYPGDTALPRAANLRAELHQMWSSYRTALKNRTLMPYVHVCSLATGVLGGIGAFSAIWFTVDLARSQQAFGVLASVAGVLSLAAMAASALLLDRLPLRQITGAATMLAAASQVVMGATRNFAVSAAGFLVFLPLAMFLAAPISMWCGRAAGRHSRTAAFSVQKVFMAGYVAATMAILGVLEQWVGIRNLLIFGGLAGVGVGLMYFRLPEPPRPGH